MFLMQFSFAGHFTWKNDFEFWKWHICSWHQVCDLTGLSLSFHSMSQMVHHLASFIPCSWCKFTIVRAIKNRPATGWDSLAWQIVRLKLYPVVRLNFRIFRSAQPISSDLFPSLVTIGRSAWEQVTVAENSTQDGSATTANTILQCGSQ
jgi:hypothetical protein